MGWELEIDTTYTCGWSVYVEFGATSTDTVTVTNTYSSDGLTTAKKFNILARQISCTAEWRFT